MLILVGLFCSLVVQALTEGSAIIFIAGDAKEPDLTSMISSGRNAPPAVNALRTRGDIEIDILQLGVSIFDNRLQQTLAQIRPAINLSHNDILDTPLHQNDHP